MVTVDEESFVARTQCHIDASGALEALLGILTKEDTLTLSHNYEGV